MVLEDLPDEGTENFFDSQFLGVSAEGEGDAKPSVLLGKIREVFDND